MFVRKKKKCVQRNNNQMGENKREKISRRAQKLINQEGKRLFEMREKKLRQHCKEGWQFKAGRHEGRETVKEMTTRKVTQEDLCSGSEGDAMKQK